MSGAESSRRLNVAHLQRKPLPGYYSIEGQFELIRRHMPSHIHCEPWICPNVSKGLLPRLANARAASRVTADIFHITGDVHYLTRHLPRAQTVLTVHDCVFLTQTRGLRRLFIRKLFYEWAVPRAGVVTAISEATRRELEQLVPSVRGKVKLVPCCVDDAFTSSPKAWPELPEVLLVGTTENKNTAAMVEAMNGLPVKLHVVGRLAPRQLEALTASGLPWRNSPALDKAGMVQAYRECDVLAFASTFEGFGLPIVEAQATGRPVLTSNISSMPEASGGAALLVNPHDKADIRRGMERLLSEATFRADLVARGQTNAARFAATTVARAYATVYEEMARGG